MGENIYNVSKHLHLENTKKHFKFKNKKTNNPFLNGTKLEQTLRQRRYVGGY